MALADLVFAGGSVYTSLTEPAPGPTHVAVLDGRVAAVGGADVGELIGPHTRLVDLAGGLLVPGFQDAHVHPVQGGLERLGCDLSGLRSEPDYVAAVAEYAGRRPDLDWVTRAAAPGPRTREPAVPFRLAGAQRRDARRGQRLAGEQSQPPVGHPRRGGPPAATGRRGGARALPGGGGAGVETALRAYTAWSAYVNHLDETGTIRVGALADLAVLDTDIVSCPPSEIGQASVVSTYVEGVEVFASS